MMKYRLSAALTAFLLLLSCLSLTVSAVDLRGVMDAMVFPENESDLAEGQTALQYRLYIPDTVERHTETSGDETPRTVTTYRSTADKTYGLLIWLHDEDSCGSDNTSQIANDAKNGLINAFLNNSAVNGEFIILAPQCPAGKTWLSGGDDAPLDAVIRWIRNFQSHYHLFDPERIFVGGISMGAEAGYRLIRLQKNTALPVSAAYLIGGTCEKDSTAEDYKDTVVCAVVSSDDPAYPSDAVTALADAVNTAGGEFSLSGYEDMGHEIWGQAFREDALLSKFMSVNAPKSEPADDPIPDDTAADTEAVTAEPADTDAPEPEATETTEPDDKTPEPFTIGGFAVTSALIAYVILAAACILAAILLISGLIRHNRSKS